MLTDSFVESAGFPWRLGLVASVDAARTARHDTVPTFVVGTANECFQGNCV